jgi:hypothetical protein
MPTTPKKKKLMQHLKEKNPKKQKLTQAPAPNFPTIAGAH